MTGLEKTGENNPESSVLLPSVQVSNAYRYGRTREDRGKIIPSLGAVLMPSIQVSNVYRYDRTREDRGNSPEFSVLMPSVQVSMTPTGMTGLEKTGKNRPESSV